MSKVIARAGILTAAVGTTLAFAAGPAQASAPVIGAASHVPSLSVVHATTSGSTVRSLRSSDFTCSGTLVGKYAVKTKAGVAVAQLEIYSRTTNKGTLIACFRHLGPTRGVALPTMATVAACADAKGAKPLAMSVATGKFRSYAGPAVVGGFNTVAHVCVAIGGEMKLPNGMVAYAKTKPACR